jgi:Recombination endonuclease VII
MYSSEIYKRYYKKNREKIRKRRKKARKQNLEHSKYRQRENFIKRTYGITTLEYERILKLQNNKCAICGSDSDVRVVGTTGRKKKFRLAIDHDHETGKVRALLCNKCNMFVGHIENNKELLPVVLKYLKDHSV